jgi:hypothetical protein
VTPQILREAGEALYGRRWQCELARELDVADRTVRRWAAGSHPMPEGLSTELRGLLKSHGLALAAVRRRLPR